MCKKYVTIKYTVFKYPVLMLLKLLFNHISNKFEFHGPIYLSLCASLQQGHGSSIASERALKTGNAQYCYTVM
jgi:hypothetical protein